MLKFDIEGITVILGQSAQENWELLSHANPNHFWIHLDSYPSGYVIIQDDKPCDRVLRKAGEICRDHTKYKRLKNIKIGCTPCSNLRKGEFVGEAEIISWRKYMTLKI